MIIRPIRNEDDLRAVFQRLEAIFQAPSGTVEADEMEVLVTLVEAYENEHCPDAATPNATLGQRLLAIREHAIADGMPTLTQDQVLAEIKHRRGEPIDNA